MKRIAQKAILFLWAVVMLSLFQHLVKMILNQVQNDERGKQ